MLRACRVSKTEIAYFFGYLGSVVGVVLVGLNFWSLPYVVFRSHEESVRIGNRIQLPMDDLIQMGRSLHSAVIIDIFHQAPRSFTKGQLS